MLFKDWVNLWIDTYKKPFVSQSTIELICYALKHILPVFGERELASIRGIDIQSFINSLNATPNMQDKCRKFLSEIFEYAYYNRYIDFNPMLAVKFKPYKYNNTHPMNEAQRKKFIRSLRGKKYEALYLTYLYTGARRNELIMPNSFEVDFKKGLVYIHGTKTAGSDRILPLFDKLRHILLKIPDYKAYFTSFKPNWVLLCFRRHMEKIKMPGFSVRSLRCTFSLMCYELGIRETTIQSWLGHTTTKTTKNFYLNKKEISLSETTGIRHEIDILNQNL